MPDGRSSDSSILATTLGVACHLQRLLRLYDLLYAICSATFTLHASASRCSALCHPNRLQKSPSPSGLHDVERPCPSSQILLSLQSYNLLGKLEIKGGELDLRVFDIHKCSASFRFFAICADTKYFDVGRCPFREMIRGILASAKCSPPRRLHRSSTASAEPHSRCQLPSCLSGNQIPVPDSKHTSYRHCTQPYSAVFCR